MSLAYCNKERCQLISEERREKWVFSIEISQWAQLPTKGPWHTADFKVLLVYKPLALRFGAPSSTAAGALSQYGPRLRLHTQTSLPCQQHREDGTYPTLVMLWGWPGSESEIICRLNTRDVWLCLSNMSFPSNFLWPLLDSLGERMAGWGQASGTTAFTSHLLSNLLFHTCLSHKEGQRKAEVHLCPDKRVD